MVYPSEHADYILRLCPDLRAIVDAELAAGNVISESWSSTTFIGLAIFFKLPFQHRHEVAETVAYTARRDPHLWSVDYHRKDLRQMVGSRSE